LAIKKSKIFSFFTEKGLYNSLHRSKSSKRAVFIENILNKQKNSGYSEDPRSHRFSIKSLKSFMSKGLKKIKSQQLNRRNMGCDIPRT
jgi:hypothetical protein